MRRTARRPRRRRSRPASPHARPRRARPAPTGRPETTAPRRPDTPAPRARRAAIPRRTPRPGWPAGASSWPGGSMSIRASRSSRHSAEISSGAGVPDATVTMSRAAPPTANWYTSVADSLSSRCASSTTNSSPSPNASRAARNTAAVLPVSGTSIRWLNAANGTATRRRGAGNPADAANRGPEPLRAPAAPARSCRRRRGRSAPLRRARANPLPAVPVPVRAARSPTRQAPPESMAISARYSQAQRK